LVRANASSVNPVDWKILECGDGGGGGGGGGEPPATGGSGGVTGEALPTSFPSPTGWDLAGTVVAVGPGCTRLQPGDRVWADLAPTFGAYAQFVVANESQLGLAPASIPLADAATLPLVGMTTLASYGVTDPRGVPAATWRAKPATLVLGGTGGCGSVGIQLANALGASAVFATGSNVSYMRELGGTSSCSARL